MASNELIGEMSTQELVFRLDSDDSLFMIDVRDPDEVADWHIPGVKNFPLAQLEHSLHEIPENSHVVLICAKGTRAQQGAEILAQHAINSAVLVGGMSSWASTYDAVTGGFGGAKVVQLRRRGKGCLSYVVGAGERCVVIDPSLESAQYEEVAGEHGWTISSVLDTHLHADHLSGARELARRNGATLLLSASDPFEFDFKPLVDGLIIALNDDVELTVSAVSVPGHTEGSTMYQLGAAAIFTGDTLFLESVGRPDLADHAEDFAHNLFQSLHERVLPLSDSTVVFPAHYGVTVEVHAGQFVARPLGELRSSLPALVLSESDFVAWAIANVKDRPPNYQRIVRINAGVETMVSDSAEVELGPNRCAIA